MKELGAKVRYAKRRTRPSKRNSGGGSGAAREMGREGSIIVIVRGPAAVE